MGDEAISAVVDTRRRGGSWRCSRARPARARPPNSAAICTRTLWIAEVSQQGYRRQGRGPRRRARWASESRDEGGTRGPSGSYGLESFGWMSKQMTRAAPQEGRSQASGPRAKRDRGQAVRKRLVGHFDLGGDHQEQTAALGVGHRALGAHGSNRRPGAPTPRAAASA
jgi:hypothetical protein